MHPKLFFFFLLASLHASHAQSCFSYDTDLHGTDVVQGLSNRQPSAEACQTSCQAYPTVNYFSWVDERFFDSNYHYACNCKSTMVRKRRHSTRTYRQENTSFLLSDITIL